MKKILLMCALLVLFMAFPLVATEDVNVSGDWNVNIVTDHGEFAQLMTFKQDGESIKVSYEDMEGEGTIKDNTIQWSIKLLTPMGDLDANFKGTVKGDTISGDVEISGMSMKFSCEKSKQAK